MHNIVGKFISKNGELCKVQEYVFIEAEQLVYDVLRVEQNVPLFAEEHLQRFYNSIQYCGATCEISIFDFTQLIHTFIIANKVENGNIKCEYFVESKCLYIYQIPHMYPSPEMYNHGVCSAFFKGMRSDPNIKQVLPIRAQAAAAIKQLGVYDVLFVSEAGEVLEGSRTNVFFIKQNTIYTASASEVLPGIMRSKVIELAAQLGIQIQEVAVSKIEISTYEAAFFTGTSPRILPISQIENHTFALENEVMLLLMKKCNELIQLYILSNKK